jgi:hypothetical protein
VFLVFGRKGFPEKVELKELRGLGVVIHGTLPFGYVQTPVRETGDHDGDGADDLVLSERGIKDTAGRVHVVFGIGPEPDFLRGDANRDGKVDLSDAVFTLGYLFLGERSRACLDAMDANDDGQVDLSDPIATLAYLFLAGPTLPSPSGSPGKDPTPDALGCTP